MTIKKSRLWQFVMVDKCQTCQQQQFERLAACSFTCYINTPFTAITLAAKFSMLTFIHSEIILFVDSAYYGLMLKSNELGWVMDAKCSAWHGTTATYKMLES
jgi:hypothetical protein